MYIIAIKVNFMDNKYTKLEIWCFHIEKAIFLANARQRSHVSQMGVCTNMIWEEGVSQMEVCTNMIWEEDVSQMEVCTNMIWEEGVSQFVLT